MKTCKVSYANTNLEWPKSHSSLAYPFKKPATGFIELYKLSSNLKDDGDDVVADVALPGQLLAIVRGEGEQGWDVEHDLVALVLCVDRVEPRRVVWNENLVSPEMQLYLEPSNAIVFYRGGRGCIAQRKSNHLTPSSPRFKSKPSQIISRDCFAFLLGYWFDNAV